MSNTVTAINLVSHTILNELAVEIYNQNYSVGWWDDPNRCLFETTQLASTEIAEATEGERKNLMDDKLKHRRMGEVELADALIRILDMGGHMGIQVGQNYAIFADPWVRRGNSIGKLHLGCNRSFINMACFLDLPESENKTSGVERWYSASVASILAVGDILGYDVIPAAREKLEFNKTRADHKRENRAKEHGKKF